MRKVETVVADEPDDFAVTIDAVVPEHLFDGNHSSPGALVGYVLHEVLVACHGNGLFSSHGLGCPVLEETEHLLLVVALVFLKQTRVLDVDNLTVLIEHDQTGKPKRPALFRRFIKALPTSPALRGW